jgi:hypothetical protein
MIFRFALILVVIMPPAHFQEAYPARDCFRDNVVPLFSAPGVTGKETIFRDPIAGVILEREPWVYPWFGIDASKQTRLVLTEIHWDHPVRAKSRAVATWKGSEDHDECIVQYQNISGLKVYRTGPLATPTLWMLLGWHSQMPYFYMKYAKLTWKKIHHLGPIAMPLVGGDGDDGGDQGDGPPGGGEDPDDRAKRMRFCPVGRPAAKVKAKAKPKPAAKAELDFGDRLPIMDDQLDNVIAQIVLPPLAPLCPPVVFVDHAEMEVIMRELPPPSPTRVVHPLQAVTVGPPHDIFSSQVDHSE